MSVSIDQQFIEYIIKSLVGHPDDVKIERRIDEKGVLLELSVNPEDLGRVIGKRGATAQSIRTLLRALGTKNDARYNLKIIDTGPPPSRQSDDTRQTDDQADEPDSTAAQDQTVTEEMEQPLNEEATQSEETKNDLNMTEAEELPESPSESHSDVISRTRKELADLDDLDL